MEWCIVSVSYAKKLILISITSSIIQLSDSHAPTYLFFLIKHKQVKENSWNLSFIFLYPHVSRFRAFQLLETINSNRLCVYHCYRKFSLKSSPIKPAAAETAFIVFSCATWTLFWNASHTSFAIVPTYLILAAGSAIVLCRAFWKSLFPPSAHLVKS